jgi:phosphate transport system substrate-binding protein
MKYFLIFLAALCQSAFADNLIIPGSGTAEYVMQALADAFAQQQTQHRVIVPSTTGTTGAVRDVVAGAAVLGRVGRPLKPDELAQGLIFVSLGRDPVAFVAGAGVTVTALKSTQLVDVFTGKTTNWKDFGGNLGPIRAIGRESTDATRQAINRVIKPFENIIFAESVKLVNLDTQVIELVDRFPGSLGFLNRSALAACKTKLVYLTLDGVEPTPQNVGIGRYPLWLELGLIYKMGKLSPAAKTFIEFTQSPAGVKVLRDHGVLAASGPF